MRPATNPPHLITLVLATALAVLTLNMFLPSLAHIAADFGVDYALANLSIAGYLIVTGVLQLIMGPLSDRYGRRPVLLWSMVVFALASVGCALAENIWAFLAFRMIQGAAIAGQVLPRAAIRDLYPPSQAAARLGQLSMAMALAPMLGPLLGGVLQSLFGWRAGFVLYAAMGFGMLALLWIDMGETNQNRSATFGAQMRQYPQLIGSRRFWGYSLCAAFSVGGFYAFITGAPMVATAWYDLSPAMLGLGIGIISLGFMAGNFVTGRIAPRVGLMPLVVAGRWVASLGSLLGLMLFLAGQGTVWVFFASAIFVGFGNGLTLANANAGLMSVRPHLAGSASGLSGALTVALGAALTSATGVVVNAQNAPYAVLGLMLAASLLSLLAALYTRWVDLREPLADT